MMASAKNRFQDVPSYVREYLFYLINIKGRSEQTVYQYYIELRLFLRYERYHKENLPVEDPSDLSDIDITSLPFSFINQLTLLDVHEYLYYAMDDRQNEAKARSRKISAIRGFFKFLEKSNNYQLDQNPVKDLENPKKGKQLPKFLSLENSINLLEHTDGKFRLRDYCILTLFLNCGMRLNELVGISMGDIQGDQLLLHGKGNKERIVYLSDACLNAIKAYQEDKPQEFQASVNDGKAIIKPYDKDALFLSSRGNRISNRQVENIVKGCLERAGLGDKGYSPHKLRHTAATLMYQYGDVDIRVLQNILGHENLGTTQIYTHVSDQQIENAMKNNPLSDLSGKKSKK